MISDVGEIIAARELLNEVMDEMRKQEVPFNEDIKVGAMIETPAAAVCVDHILEVVDYISVGTNDLIQYVLAVDRINENVAHLYQPLHPAVLRLLKTIFSAANKAGKPVAICGELGGDPLATMLINGLGRIDELSMEPHAIPKVKKILRKISLEDARKMADHALSLNSAKDINNFIVSEMQSRFPSDFNRDTNFEEKSIPNSQKG
jgi:phosphotransferase system enzyme I (PtsI)